MQEFRSRVREKGWGPVAGPWVRAGAGHCSAAGKAGHWARSKAVW